MKTRDVLTLFAAGALTIDETVDLVQGALDENREVGRMEGFIEASNLATAYPAEPVSALLTQVKKLAHNSSHIELGHAYQSRKWEEISS